MGEVPFERLLQLPGEPLAVENRIQLVVDAEAANVDVRRSDRADCGVDAYRLGVQIALLVKEDAHAGVHDVRNVGVPCPAGDYVARTRCAQHYLDVDARQGSRLDRKSTRLNSST